MASQFDTLDAHGAVVYAERPGVAQVHRTIITTDSSLVISCTASKLCKAGFNRFEPSVFACDTTPRLAPLVKKFGLPAGNVLVHLWLLDSTGERWHDFNDTLRAKSRLGYGLHRDSVGMALSLTADSQLTAEAVAKKGSAVPIHWSRDTLIHLDDWTMLKVFAAGLLWYEWQPAKKLTMPVIAINPLLPPTKSPPLEGKLVLGEQSEWRQRTMTGNEYAYPASFTSLNGGFAVNGVPFSLSAFALADQRFQWKNVHKSPTNYVRLEFDRTRWSGKELNPSEMVDAERWIEEKQRKLTERRTNLALETPEAVKPRLLVALPNDTLSQIPSKPLPDSLPEADAALTRRPTANQRKLNRIDKRLHQLQDKQDRIRTVRDSVNRLQVPPTHADWGAMPGAPGGAPFQWAKVQSLQVGSITPHRFSYTPYYSIAPLATGIKSVYEVNQKVTVYGAAARNRAKWFAPADSTWYAEGGLSYHQGPMTASAVVSRLVTSVNTELGSQPKLQWLAEPSASVQVTKSIKLGLSSSFNLTDTAASPSLDASRQICFVTISIAPIEWEVYADLNHNRYQNPLDLGTEQGTTRLGTTLKWQMSVLRLSGEIGGFYAGYGSPKNLNSHQFGATFQIQTQWAKWPNLSVVYAPAQSQLVPITAGGNLVASGSQTQSNLNAVCSYSRSFAKLHLNASLSYAGSQQIYQLGSTEPHRQQIDLAAATVFLKTKRTETELGIHRAWGPGFSNASARMAWLYKLSKAWSPGISAQAFDDISGKGVQLGLLSKIQWPASLEWRLEGGYVLQSQQWPSAYARVGVAVPIVF